MPFLDGWKPQIPLCLCEAHIPLCRLQAHIADLKRELAMHDQLVGRSGVVYEPFTDSQKMELRAQVTVHSVPCLSRRLLVSVIHIRQACLAGPMYFFTDVSGPLRFRPKRSSVDPCTISKCTRCAT